MLKNIKTINSHSCLKKTYILNRKQNQYNKHSYQNILYNNYLNYNNNSVKLIVRRLVYIYWRLQSSNRVEYICFIVLLWFTKNFITYSPFTFRMVPRMGLNHVNYNDNLVVLKHARAIYIFIFGERFAHLLSLARD